MALYRASGRLYRHRAQIESALFDRVHDLFGLECLITLYDLTNTYFECQAASDAQARPDHSKEKRSHYSLFTLYTRGFSHFVTSMTAPIAFGRSDSCRVSLSPTGIAPPLHGAR
jgi:hypothetical protein